MTVKQAAERLELSLWSTYTLIQSGKLGHQRLGPRNGKIIVTDRHIEQYRTSCERRGAIPSCPRRP